MDGNLIYSKTATTNLFKSGGVGFSGNEVNAYIDNLVLYEKVSVPYHTVTFISDGTVWRTVQVKDGGEMLLPSDMPVKAGHTFTDWTDEDGNPISLEAMRITEDMTVYARFEPTEYRIFQDTNMENGAIESRFSACYNEIVNLEVQPDEGYALVEGSLRYINPATGSETPILNESFIMPCHDVVVTAEFQKIGISLEPGNLTIKIGDTSLLTAVLQPAEMFDQPITWMSSNESVAKVSQDGMVTGVGAGYAEITASSEGYSAVCKVEVTKEDTNGAGDGNTDGNMDGSSSGNDQTDKPTEIPKTGDIISFLPLIGVLLSSLVIVVCSRKKAK